MDYLSTTSLDRIDKMAIKIAVMSALRDLVKVPKRT